MRSTASIVIRLPIDFLLRVALLTALITIARPLSSR